jgi:cell division protein FtsB
MCNCKQKTNVADLKRQIDKLKKRTKTLEERIRQDKTNNTPLKEDILIFND